MNRGTVRNMQSFIPKINLIKLVRLIGFIIGTQGPVNGGIRSTDSCHETHKSNVYCLSQVCFVTLRDRNTGLSTAYRVGTLHTIQTVVATMWIKRPTRCHF